MGLGLVLAVLLPFLCNNGFFEQRALINPSDILWLMPIYYSFCVPAYIALFSLDRLLAAVRKDEVFSSRNVRYLRIITWCCFGAAIILLVSTLASIVFAVLAILAAFFGIVLRVVKNLFAAAVALKDENDFTI
ncbi:MAG: DUF2975 domain-containing protein [Coriobacteriia bacterium]|nr:DUF2975 domain-containing protein [Coriobacteriia bacterium]